MKKKLCLILAVCFIFCSFVFSANAATELEAYNGMAYYKDIISLYTAESINLDDFVGVGPFDFYGVSIAQIELYRAASPVLNVNIYHLTISPDVDIIEACDILNAKEDIRSAEPIFIINPYEDWGESTYRKNFFADMTADERKEYMYFIPDEIVFCLDYELDLTEFEGEGTHYLFGVPVGEISRLDNEDGFVYNIKFNSDMYINNYQCYCVFASNDNVLWVDVESTYGNGDVNRDDVVDSADYLLVKRICFNSFEPSIYAAGHSDINNDGIIDSADYVLLKRACF